MASEPSTEDEWTVHSLNVQGTFFHRWCTDVINQTSGLYLYATEYPVEFPSITEKTIKGLESRLDIYARIPATRENGYKSAINLFIECKKNNPDFTNWVFFPRYPSRSPEYYDLLTISNHPIGEAQWKPLYHIHRRNTQPFEITDEGWESRGKYLGYKSGDKTKTANSSIYDACYQVVLGTHSIAFEHHDDLKRLGTKGEQLPFTRFMYIPMVVTTANLYILEFSPSDISVDRGELPMEKAKLSPVKNLVFEYPIPPHLQIKSTDWDELPEAPEPDTLIRRHVLIVNSNSFEETIEWMVNSKKYLLFG